MRPSASSALAALALVGAVGPVPAAGGQPLGRLFFSAEQRREFEYGWRSGTGEAGAGKPALAGVVWRSEGRSTAWINGAPVYQKAAPLRIAPDRGDAAQLYLHLRGGAPLRLRVAESAK